MTTKLILVILIYLVLDGGTGGELNTDSAHGERLNILWTAVMKIINNHELMIISGVWHTKIALKEHFQNRWYHLDQKERQRCVHAANEYLSSEFPGVEFRIDAEQRYTGQVHIKILSIDRNVPDGKVMSL